MATIGNDRRRMGKEKGRWEMVGGTALIAPSMEGGTGIMILLSLNRVHCLHDTLKSEQYTVAMTKNLLTFMVEAYGSKADVNSQTIRRGRVARSGSWTVSRAPFSHDVSQNSRSPDLVFFTELTSR